MELFSTEGERSALPFPIQAQAWPCALAGFDVIAVAPTGGWGGGFFSPNSVVTLGVLTVSVKSRGG